MAGQEDSDKAADHAASIRAARANDPLDDVTGDQGKPVLGPNPQAAGDARMAEEAHLQSLTDGQEAAIIASEAREEELSEQLARIEKEREHRTTADTDSPIPYKTRYHIHRGGQGLFTVMRTVNEGCDDYEDDGPLEYYTDNVCVCSSPFTALHIAKALETLHPDGNIT